MKYACVFRPSKYFVGISWKWLRYTIRETWWNFSLRCQGESQNELTGGKILYLKITVSRIQPRSSNEILSSVFKAETKILAATNFKGSRELAKFVTRWFYCTWWRTDIQQRTEKLLTLSDKYLSCSRDYVVQYWGNSAIKCELFLRQLKMKNVCVYMVNVFSDLGSSCVVHVINACGTEQEYRYVSLNDGDAFWEIRR
jgi:hypothetical protein